jgi:putative ATP-dependent endonuclease of the OLD family
MSLDFKLSAKIRNFKCFGPDEQGFDSICPMNLIIGRNNSGKSSLLDLICAITDVKPKFTDIQRHKGQQPQIILQAPLNENEIRYVFNEKLSGGGIPGANHWDYGRKYVGSYLKWFFNTGEEDRFIELDEPSSTTPPVAKVQDGGGYLRKLAKVKNNPFQNRIFKRISAERDVVPESDTAGEHKVQGNGQGATNIIQNFINKSTLPSELVETTLLTELNLIFGSDAHFTDIVCQQLPNNNWELYLEEEIKGRVPLSQSGSGLKTIILILIFLYLVPKIENRLLHDYVFAFEELENNLHPALLRRLLAYLYKAHKETGCIFFLTTHSNVAIDQFSKNEDAQIIHVTHDSKTAIARTIKTYIDNKGVLDDLDVRASDLLQSNGVIWVEGPSDRIYINRWIEVWSDGKFHEGAHYQCIFYGGRLLSHLSANEPADSIDEAISIFNINRNAIILIDSDKQAAQTRINETKRRIIDEIEKLKGFAWVTKGREIENYIPVQAVENLIGASSILQVGQYDDFFQYLDKIKKEEGSLFLKKKPMLAEKIAPYLTKENMGNVLDLGERLDQVCDRIRSWNSVQPIE